MSRIEDVAPVARVIRVLSSMATRHLLADLAQKVSAVQDVDLVVDSMGGVEAARRVREGYDGDVLVLAEDAISSLAAQGHLHRETIRPLFRSLVAVAATFDMEDRDISTPDALRRTILGSPRVAYSTGPSGVALQGLLRSWGIADEMEERLVQAPAGVPVGSLLVDGRADLGFQQLSELMEIDGIDVLGVMPPEAEIATVFCGALLSRSSRRAQGQAVLEAFTGNGVAALVRRRGMEPVEAGAAAQPIHPGRS